jgi:hypothetical protein
VGTVGLFSGPYRPSERPVQQALGDFFQVDVVLGRVNGRRQEVSQAVAEPVAEATEFAQAQPVANADETGWVPGSRDGTNPERRKAGLWVRVTPWVRIFQGHLSPGPGSGQSGAGRVGRLPNHGSVDGLGLVAA